MIATRSPRSRPLATNPLATASTCAANSRAVTSTHEPSIWRRKLTVSPNRSALANTMSVRFSSGVTVTVPGATYSRTPRNLVQRVMTCCTRACSGRRRRDLPGRAPVRGRRRVRRPARLARVLAGPDLGRVPRPGRRGPAVDGPGRVDRQHGGLARTDARRHAPALLPPGRPARHAPAAVRPAGDDPTPARRQGHRAGPQDHAGGRAPAWLPAVNHI